MKKLNDLFYNLDEPTAFTSQGPLQRASKTSAKRVSTFLENQPVYSRHKQIRYKFPRKKTTGLFVLSHVQADLVEMSELLGKGENKGHRYCLTMIDCYSRYAFVSPLKDKTGASIVHALESTFDLIGARPAFLLTDRGREFVNAQVKTYLADRHINLAHTESDLKCAMVERFNRTLKTRLYKYLTHARTRKWINVIDKITLGINHSHHRIIKTTPDRVFRGVDRPADQQSDATEHTPRALKYKEGDHVRMSRADKAFRKGYRSGWTEEAFVVVQAIAGDVPTYRLVDFDGEEISGLVYEHELVRAV